MTKPISPSQVAAEKINRFPSYVFEAFNELITQNFSGGVAIVYQKDVIDLIKAKSADIPSNNTIFSNNWLNIEEVYRDAGWSVSHGDRPAFNKNYHASFRFETPDKIF